MQSQTSSWIDSAKSTLGTVTEPGVTVTCGLPHARLRTAADTELRQSVRRPLPAMSWAAAPMRLTLDATAKVAAPKSRHREGYR